MKNQVKILISIGQGHPCVYYKNISQVERRRDNVINASDNALCDLAISSGMWYRFYSPAGYQMLEECPPLLSCGTREPVWLQGKHPSVEGTDETTYRVCQRKYSKPDDCCAYTWPVHILNCTNYYVYKLHRIENCYAAYCAGTENPCPPHLNSENGYTPGCTDNFPKLVGKVRLTMSQTDPSLTFHCDFTGRIDINTVLVTDWYVSGLDDKNTYHTPVWTDNMVERKRSTLKEDWIKTKLGSNV